MAIHYPSGQKPAKKVSSAIPTPHESIYARRGMSLEAELNESNGYYLATKRAVVHKKPTPVQLVKVDYPKRSKAVIREAYFRRPSTTDYNGVYHSHYIDFDAKETRNKRSFPLKNFHQHQVSHMKACVEQGGICFAIIKFSTLDRCFLYPATNLFAWWQHFTGGGRKSIPLTEIIKDGYEIEYGLNPRLKYLDALDSFIHDHQL
ncbi:Holliday junction resolvase RecU [Limosilactobacillus sp.]|uniref:Holliday junction resolvase RecU n=1 Tax=Limosilactobacillus sp. TaxID=2773925 RepID=UPI00345E31A1